MDYLKKVAGLRTVPIEVGKTYLEEAWSQKLMALGDFIDEHVGEDPSRPPEQTGYLAQTQLFDQIPELRKDILPILKFYILFLIFP
jgi:[protein]-arginine 3-hydroxylase / protease